MSAPHQYPYASPPPGNPNVKTALAGGAIAASLLANIFLFWQLHDVKSDSLKDRQTLQAEIETLKENNTAMTSTQRKRLEDLREELDNRSRQLNMAASQAKREALSYAEQQSKRLESQQQQTAQKLTSDLSDVKQKADSANTKLADVGTEVTGVKTDLASTKSELDKTIGELKKVSGDLGVTSGYVATNGKELAELKRRGERNYTEFKLTRTKDFQRVGDISVQLKKADPKHNRFSLDVLADDKKTEKKDRYINEPLQFYVSKALYELVVNNVGKDQISGYLSTPKYTASR